jgi:hypothetical protein
MGRYDLFAQSCVFSLSSPPVMIGHSGLLITALFQVELKPWGHGNFALSVNRMVLWRMTLIFRG